MRGQEQFQNLMHWLPALLVVIAIVYLAWTYINPGGETKKILLITDNLNHPYIKDFKDVLHSLKNPKVTVTVIAKDQTGKYGLTPERLEPYDIIIIWQFTDKSLYSEERDLIKNSGKPLWIISNSGTHLTDLKVGGKPQYTGFDWLDGMPVRCTGQAKDCDVRYTVSGKLVRIEEINEAKVITQNVKEYPVNGYATFEGVVKQMRNLYGLTVVQIETSEGTFDGIVITKSRIGRKIVYYNFYPKKDMTALIRGTLIWLLS